MLHRVGEFLVLTVVAMIVSFIGIYDGVVFILAPAALPMAIAPAVGHLLGIVKWGHSAAVPILMLSAVFVTWWVILAVTWFVLKEVYLPSGQRPEGSK